MTGTCTSDNSSIDLFNFIGLLFDAYNSLLYLSNWIIESIPYEGISMGGDKERRTDRFNNLIGLKMKKKPWKQSNQFI